MINERIRLIIDQKFNGNASAFSRKIGISQSTIKDIVGIKATKPSYDTLRAIVSDETLNISAEWLLLGKGGINTDKSLDNEASKLIEAVATLTSSNKELVTTNLELVKMNSKLLNQKDGGVDAPDVSCADAV